ncbi:MAG: ribonuclease HII [Ruminococcaceae bacterium]|nr:ribonuclease HII [Oscillospiraceae bacterium]
MNQQSDIYLFEAGIVSEDMQPYCGVDEAGRGPLAGPVYAAAVILGPDTKILGLNDSKKISPKKRDLLYEEILKSAAAVSVGVSDVSEIEELNILAATFLAMNRAIEGLNPKAKISLIDGNQGKGILTKHICITGGDALCASIAAASIVAKVQRDRYMIKLAEKYPMYGFEKHKGYGTAAHYAAIKEHGACKHHRMSFLKNLH